MTTVEKIHKAFDDAHLSLLHPSIKKSRADRLKGMGFDPEIMLPDLAAYYQETYPFLKFMTVDDLDRICNKYNLVYAHVSAYKEIVPEKNLIEIEKVSNEMLLKTKDWEPDFYIYTIIKTEYVTWWKRINFPNTFVSEDNIENNTRMDYIYEKLFGVKLDCKEFKKEEVSRQGFFIAAPISHFDKKKLNEIQRGSISFFSRKNEDPIVFRYCRGGIQVVTKWGPEANDPELAVPILN